MASFLNRQTKACLQKYLRDTALSARTKARCEAMLLWNEGISPTEMSERLDVSRQALYSWKKAFQTHGVSWLKEERAPSSAKTTSTLVESKAASVLKRIQNEIPPYGKRWTVRSLAALEKISHNTVAKILKAHDIQLKDYGVVSSVQKGKSKRRASRQPSDSAVGVKMNQQTIAKRAGVSPATVSLALRNRPNVSQETKERIFSIAASIGYTKKEHYSLGSEAHIHRGEETIAFITSKRPLVENHYAGVLAGCQKAGYALSTFYLEDYGNPSRLSSILYHRGIRGVILSRILDPRKLRWQFDWEHFAMISLPQSFPIGHMVGVAPEYALKMGWLYMQNAGYRRIGLLVQPNIVGGKFESVEALFRYYAKNKEYEGGKVSIFTQLPQDAPDLFRRWLKRFKPDVVAGFPQIHHPAFFQQIVKLGYNIPEDFSYVSLHRELEDAPEVAGVNQRGRDQAFAAVQLLESQLLNHHYGVPSKMESFVLYMAPSWKDGKSFVC